MNWYSFQKEQIIERLDLHQKENSEKGMKVLTEEQYNASLELLSSNRFIKPLQGDAGCGKTTALRTVVQVLKEENIKVRGICMQGVAAQKLQEETGLKAMTLHSYLSEERSPADRNRVVICDEASMVDSRNMALLIKTMRKHEDKLLVVGDMNQLESISAGNVFRRVCEESKEELVTMTSNLRQRDPILREAVEIAKKGDMARSLKLLDKNGCIHEEKNLESSYEKIYQKYKEEKSLIIANTREQQENLNNYIRKRLIEEGALSEERFEEIVVKKRNSYGRWQEERKEFVPGDTVAFLKNEYKEYDVRNGERGRITHVDKNSIAIESEDGREIVIDPEKYNYIDYGLVLTSYKAQGQSFDSTLILIDGTQAQLSDLRNQYINLTRARDSVHIFVDSKRELIRASTIKNTKSDTLDMYITPEQIESSIECLKNDQDVDPEKKRMEIAEPEYYSFGGRDRAYTREL